MTSDSGVRATTVRDEPTSETSYAQALDLWRDQRMKRNEIADTGEYTEGFQNGYAGPPGLVDGSADFNLGHSDGMLAKRGVLPELTDGRDGK